MNLTSLIPLLYPQSPTCTISSSKLLYSSPETPALFCHCKAFADVLMFAVTMDMNAGFNQVPGPSNGGSANNGMGFQNGTPPASDMSAPPSGGGQDTPKTTLW